MTTANGYPLILDSPSIEYPFSQTFVQHEHALVTVDGDCKIALWDQYGDDMEQAVVENASVDLFMEYIKSRGHERSRDSLISDERSLFLF